MKKIKELLPIIALIIGIAFGMLWKQKTTYKQKVQIMHLTNGYDSVNGLHRADSARYVDMIRALDRAITEPIFYRNAKNQYKIVLQEIKK